jgi:beta-glucanase (GH16 family)
MLDAGKRSRKGKSIVIGSVLGAFLLLAGVVSAVVLHASGPPQLPFVHTQYASSTAATSAPACSGLDEFLGECSNTTTTAAPATRTTASTTTTTACSGLELELGLCKAPTTTTVPPTTTTTVPPTTTTTTSSSSDCGGAAGAPPVAPPSGSWTCTFDDEFEGTSLNTAVWQPQLTATSDYYTGAAPNQVCYVNNSKTISESGGYLSVSIVQVPQFTCDGIDGDDFTTEYEGGMVTSYQLFSQEYGYFQASAEMPASTINGLQETLWMYPENETKYGPWPDSGEIDYGEFYSEYPNNDIPVVHYPGSANDPNATNDYCTIANTPTAGQFNTYALMWTPTTITAYFNGKACIVDNYSSYVTSPDTAPEPFNQPFFMAFTAALGINTDAFEPGTTPLPATTKIKYMRVWQY